MPFRSAGADISMRRTVTGKLDFDWAEDGPNAGNPKYSDDNVHRVLSLLIEHRAFAGSPGSPGEPGWIWDTAGNRGSLIYTVKNVRRSTPSQLEAYALDALKRAVEEGWILDPTAKAFLRATPPHLDISWRNPGGRPSPILRVPLAA